MMFDVRGTAPSLAHFAQLYRELTGPTMTRYDVTLRYRVLLLLTYSIDCRTPGVLEETDGDLCNAVGLGRKLTQFRKFLNKMIEYNHLREIVVDNKRRYEISRKLLPEYEDDARLPDRWDKPAARLTVRNPLPHPLELDPIDGKRQRGGNHKWEIEATASEKTAYSRFCEKERIEAEKEGRLPAEISRDKWVVVYRDGRGESVTFASPNAVTFAPIDVTFEDTKSYNGTSDVTFASRDGGGVGSLVTERELQQQQRTDEAKVTAPKVTSLGEAKVTLTPEQQAVYAFLTSKGLWQEVARPAALWCDLETARLYVDWVRSQKPTDFGALLRYQIENQHPIPPDFIESQDRKKRDLARQEAKQRQGEEQKRQEQEVMAQASAVQTRIEAYWQARSEAERAALLYEAANTLHAEGRRWWKDYLKRRATQSDLQPMKLLQVALDAQINRLLHDLLEIPYDKKQSAVPERFVMPPEWDGLLPEEGELPPGLGIPNLTEEGT